MHPLRRWQRLALGAAIALALLAGPSHQAAAQAIFRSVGPDGRVTFSDRELGHARAAVVKGDLGAGAAERAGDALPYALREVQEHFPVTLYTGSDCNPCASARALLVQRGIPFTELTVQTTADLQALRALSGQDRLPFATIGQQHLTGFAADEWRQYLDAAGYPQTAAPTAGYRRPAARALAPVVPAAAAAAPTPAPRTTGRGAPTPVPSNTRVTPTNPAGLSF